MQVNDSLVLLLAQSSSLVFFGYDKPLLFELETEKTRIVLSYMVNVKSFLNNILLYLPLTATLPPSRHSLVLLLARLHMVWRLGFLVFTQSTQLPLTVKEVIFSFAIYMQCIYRQFFLKVSKELN